MTNNPLIDKYFELYPEKKEPPKMPRIEDYEGEETIADELKKSNKKPLTLKTYDPYDLKTSYLKVREQLCEGRAKLLSMEMKIGDPKSQFHKNNRIVFEIELYDD